MRQFITCIVFSLFSFYLKGQELKRGQAVPEIVSNQTMNFPTSIFRLSDYRGKPLIIDFWSFNCSYCLRNFSKTELLQKKFGDKLQIVYVNQESLKQTKAFFEKFKKLKTKITMPNLPMVTGDKVFHKLFPINALPIIVWIDAEGKFRYRSSLMNEEQLTAFVKGKAPNLFEIDPKTDFIKDASLFEQPNKKYLKDISYYSYIAHYLNGSDIGNSNRQSNDNGKLVRLSKNEGSILEFIMAAFSEYDEKYVFRNGINVVLKVADSSKYVRPKRNELPDSEYSKWQANYLFRYECAVPIEKKDRVFEFMRQDLCRYFDLDVRVEKRMMKCLALVSITDELQFKERGLSKSASYTAHLRSDRYDSLFFANEPMSKLLWRIQLDHYHLGVNKPIVNRTTYEGRIDMVFPVMYDDETTIEYWKEQLARYGLALIEENCLTDVLVIREK
jgi:thiol-disulfide isomerase/thioredoxin